MMQKTTNNEGISPVGDQPGQGFYGLGISPKILSILENIKFKVPTAIQLKTIPLALEAKDIIGIAQTGTGKTHAFAIPIVQRLVCLPGKALVLAPTRELALQIEEAFRGLAHSFGMKTACLIGGASMHDQLQALCKVPQVVIATPGRLIDHMKQWNIMLDDVNILVLDEADRMLDLGFAPQIEQILRFTSKQRQTMIFSATIPKEIMKIAGQHMKLPVCVEIVPSGTVAERVTQELFIVKKDAKVRLLEKLLARYSGAILLFSRTKHGAHRIAGAIKHMGYRAVEMHSDRSLNQRREALQGFKSGKYKVLVATDIAARGIDVIGIELVINYDIPEDAHNYVHRIGRTGRAGHKGHAISFATPEQSNDIRNIEKLIRTSLPVSRHPDIVSEDFVRSSSHSSDAHIKRHHSQRHHKYHGSSFRGR